MIRVSKICRKDSNYLLYHGLQIVQNGYTNLSMNDLMMFFESFIDYFLRLIDVSDFFHIFATTNN